MMVICSWVAFWIVKADAAGRCSLGITTVLSVIKIGFGDKGKPQVKPRFFEIRLGLYGKKFLKCLINYLGLSN